MMQLNNGASPLVWLVRNGGNGERPFCGVVVARTSMGYHPYVCWSMFSDDGEGWDCVWGNYCHSVEEAIETFNKRIVGAIEDTEIYEARKYDEFLGRIEHV